MHLCHWIMGQDLRMSTASLFVAVCVCVSVCLLVCCTCISTHRYAPAFPLNDCFQNKCCELLEHVCERFIVVQAQMSNLCVDTLTCFESSLVFFALAICCCISLCWHRQVSSVSDQLTYALWRGGPKARAFAFAVDNGDPSRHRNT